MRSWNNLDQDGNEPPSDAYLLASYDPLTPMRFIDPATTCHKKTLDVNTLPAEIRKDCRNMPKIKYIGNEDED